MDLDKTLQDAFNCSIGLEVFSEIGMFRHRLEGPTGT